MVRRKCFFFLILMSVMSLFAFTSCDDEDVTINHSVSGSAEATPSDVKNGDEISLTIGVISHSSSSEINGNEYFPIIHY